MSYVAAATVAVGATQAIVGGVKAHGAQKALENLQSPIYTPNKAIADYYQSAKNRAETGPYNSSFYQMAERNAGRGLSAGISALTDRRSTGNVAGLVQGNEDQLQKAQVQAEAIQRQNFAQYAHATGMQAADDKYAFDINKQAPFERKYGLLAAKAGGGNKMMNAGVSNVFSGIQGYQQEQQQDKYLKYLKSMGGMI
jgi:hypothetical protein